MEALLGPEGALELHSEESRERGDSVADENKMASHSWPAPTPQLPRMTNRLYHLIPNPPDRYR